MKYFYSFYGGNEISSEKYKLLFSLVTFESNSVMKELIRIPALSEKMVKRIESPARRERFRPLCLLSGTIPFLLSHLNKVAGRTVVWRAQATPFRPLNAFRMHYPRP